MTERLAIGVAPSEPLHGQLICSIAAVIQLRLWSMRHQQGQCCMWECQKLECMAHNLLFSSVLLCGRYYYLDNV